MGIGAAAMAAGYAAQGNERKNQLTTSYEQRADLARQRLVVANDELKAAERQVSVGMAGTMGVFEGRMKVAEAEAQPDEERRHRVEVRDGDADVVEAHCQEFKGMPGGRVGVPA
jgi:hypothetical protein